MRLSYHPDAEAELAEAARFYERKVPGLGTRFRSDFESAVARILKSPDRWRVLEKEIRRFLMQRFPYSILYRVEGEVVRILVVEHHSRHPDYWKGRLVGGWSDAHIPSWPSSFIASSRTLRFNPQ